MFVAVVARKSGRQNGRQRDAWQRAGGNVLTIAIHGKHCRQTIIRAGNIFKGKAVMDAPSDEDLIQKAKSEILQDSEAALDMLCLLLATTKKFEDRYEWSFVLGRAFALMQEQANLKNSSKLRYDEVGELMIDETIKDLLGGFDAKQKANIYAFLKGALKPFDLSTIEAIAGKI